MPPPKMPIPTISQSHVSGCRQLKNKPGVYWNPTTQKFYKLANVQSHPATPGVASMNHPDVPKIDPVAEARKKVEETHLDPSFYPGEDDQKI